jgi:DNA-binding NarL/FixJ family response regulator
MKSPARLLIAEDHGILRDALRSALDPYRDEFHIVGETDNGLDTIQQARTLKPDLILLDIRMPNSNGTDVLEEIKKRLPDIKILMFTQFESADYVHAAITAGANGYFVKRDGMTALVEAMRTVLNGHVYLSPRISRYILDGYLANSAHSEQPTRSLLSSRDRMIIKLIAEGQKNREIAGALKLSVRTIEKYRSDIMKKLNLESTPALIQYAFEHNIV